jgi:hypothetical protein
MGDVGRRLAFVAAWLTLTAITAGVAWLGIRSVLLAAAPQRAAPLSASQLRAAAPPPMATVAPPPTTATPSSVFTAEGVPPSGAEPSQTWTPGPDQRGGTSYRRTIRTAGGEAVISCAKGSVQVVSLSPNLGYTVNVTRYGGDSVIVSFLSDRKTSRVWGRWWDGPYAEVSESLN